MVTRQLDFWKCLRCITTALSPDVPAAQYGLLRHACRSQLWGSLQVRAILAAGHQLPFEVQGVDVDLPELQV